MSMYRPIFDHGFRRLSAEKAHTMTMAGLKSLQATVAGQRAVTSLNGRIDPMLATEVFGRVVPGPLGVAAGFDKNAEAMDALGSFGFGFVEVGTITAHPQPGNPKPRLFRLPADEAIINRMGFNNDGAAAVAARLEKRVAAGAQRVVMGINIGKSKVTAPEDAADDYRLSTAQLAPYADYLVVNVSSPNTPGLRDLQVVSALRPIMEAVQDAASKATDRAVPILVKIAPDLADADVTAVADMVRELELAGVVATNTTIKRSGLRTSPEAVKRCGAGGLSGPVLRNRSLQVLRALRDRLPRDATVISVGGITTADDAWDRITAGANLLQGYTAMIYNGPAWPRNVHTGLAEKLRQHRFASLSEAIYDYI